MLEFTYDKNAKIRLSKAVFQYYPNLSYTHLMGLLRKKDVSVNGKRVNRDVELLGGESIRLYTKAYSPSDYVYKAELVFENDYVLLFWKNKGLETQGDISLEALARRTAPEACACHRLDVNTDGLLIVAKSEAVKEKIVAEMNAGKIEKFYLGALYGSLERDVVDKSAYIVKDAEHGVCKVYDSSVPGSLPIRTVFKKVAELPGYTVAEIELFTGRTHQIRAQAFQMGNYLLGDGKYCPERIRKQFPYKKQALSAYKLAFNTDIAELDGLNGRVIVHECELSAVN